MNKAKLPQFICLGAQKAGTTTLHEILKEHPDIYLPEDKEANFFDRDEEYRQGAEYWIDKHFRQALDQQKKGVFTPDYLYYTEVPERIKSTYAGQDLKFIVILRHPVDRAFSHYLMSKRRGYEKKGFEEAIAEESNRIHKGEFERNHFSYLDRGRYSTQIKRYFEYFDRSDFLFLSFENEIRKNFASTIKKIEKFIGVPHCELDLDKHSNYAAEARYSSLQRVVRGDSQFKRLLKKLLKQNFRRRIKKRIIDFNESKPVSVNKPDHDLRLQIMNDYFLEETAELHLLTGIDFSYWLT